MATIPWDEPATAMKFTRGLERARDDFPSAPLRDAVRYVLTQANTEGDGYIIRMDDGSQAWEGPEIGELGRLLAKS